MSTATVTSKGQVTLPKEIRTRLHLEAGEKVDFRVDEKTGTAVLVPLNRRVDDVFGVLSRRGRRKRVSTQEMDKAIGNRFRKEYL